MTGDGEDMLSAVATGQIIVQFRHEKKQELTIYTNFEILSKMVLINRHFVADNDRNDPKLPSKGKKS